MRLADTPLLTDLYQLTMMQAYHDQGMEETAVFEFFARSLPPHRNFLVAAGLEQALGFLESLRFDSEELEWLNATGRFRQSFLDRLERLRFTGDVHAMPEGTVFFPNEPILRVTAPLPEAQLVESRLINLLHFSTLVASKAARCVLAAPGRQLVDFGMRRAHGAEAGLLAARSAYLAGFAGTATVAAGWQFGIPLYGTMAHSFVEAHDHEGDAFDRFIHSNPRAGIFIIDTYDTEAAARKVIDLAKRLRGEGIAVRGVRLDSGDISTHARAVRALLDKAGLDEVKIFSSGNMDEYALRDLMAAGTPVDGFGVGTKLDTSDDAPYLDCAYKLQEYAGKPRRKRSEGKATLPGRKQVYRWHDTDGLMHRDLVTVEDDVQDGSPLVHRYMAAGRRTGPQPDLDQTRRHCALALARLPGALRTLEPAEPYPVAIAESLHRLAAQADELVD
ncbi:MAG TPA: nicotinate phosphoribosyltransferase [Gammaproteobacteria bacterium]|nr:nicotinate phosphoribosyltransferase [Gammaproteobacteria bacterium]